MKNISIVAKKKLFVQKNITSDEWREKKILMKKVCNGMLK